MEQYSDFCRRELIQSAWNDFGDTSCRATANRYQHVYLSIHLFFALLHFFAVLPMPYPDGNNSDGKIILDIIRGRNSAINERTFRVQWNGEKKQWYVLNHNQELVKAFENEDDACNKAREIAEKARPSRILNVKNGLEKEIHNYPRIPL